MTTSTSPIRISYAEHRADAPVWLFHIAVARLLWLFAMIGYAAEVFMFRHAGTRLTVLAVVSFVAVLAALITVGLNT